MRECTKIYEVDDVAHDLKGSDGTVGDSAGNEGSDVFELVNFFDEIRDLLKLNIENEYIHTFTLADTVRK